MRRDRPEAGAARQNMGPQWRAYLRRMRGGGANPPRMSTRQVLFSTIGIMVSLMLVVEIADYADATLLMAPFGASALLIFVAYDSPLAQPRNVVGSHLLASLVALVIYHIFGLGPFAAIAATGLAAMAMQLTRTVHAPAAADPILIMAGGYIGWDFLIAPMLVGPPLLVLCGLAFNNLIPHRRYPIYWW
jgi:CBS-domain-containing membrane protein